MDGGEFPDAVPGEVVIREVELGDVAEHRDQSDQTLVIQLTITQVQHIHPTKVSISEYLPGDLMNPCRSQVATQETMTLRFTSLCKV